MSREGTFAIYCLERYRHAKSLTGRDAAALFAKHRVIEYVRKFFESLHVISEQLIVEDIDAYIARQTFEAKIVSE